MAQAVALFVLTAASLITIEALVGLVLLHGVVVGFNQPTNKALIPSLIPRDDLPTLANILCSRGESPISRGCSVAKRVLDFVTGTGAEVGAPLAQHADVNKLSFADSVPRGIRGMVASS